MNAAIIIAFSVLSLSLVYFLLNVCIQFNRINNLNLQLGMDVTTLISSEEEFNLNYFIRKFAMRLYILSKKFKL
ncbi:hypothetical protein [Terrisporobacter sp.]|uniref:hypothetical protein n=1 Tax=Terrisporobacter sp. TaxID=1965305 RepID=UPI002620B58F|nr:hypothetical protein [Terrisporobacter sp.]